MSRRRSVPALYTSEPSAPVDVTKRIPPWRIVSIWGGDTALGSKLLWELAHSDQVEKVYVVALNDLPDLRKMASQAYNKVDVRMLSPDGLEGKLSHITQCDLGFMVMTTERDASYSMSTKNFCAINHYGPIRFVERMYELGALHVSVLSYAGADVSSHSTFCERKGKMELGLSEIRREAQDFGPMITIYRMPANIMVPANRSRSRSRSLSFSCLPTTAYDRLYKDDANPPVNIEQVGNVMMIDAFEKALSKGPPGTPRPKNRFQLFHSVEVLRILSERARHRGP